MKRLLCFLAALLPTLAGADTAEVCYNYGCNVAAEVTFSATQLAPVEAQLRRAGEASSERLILAEVLGRLYRLAGTQTPIWRDKGGNSEDDEVEGRMDCIDHSTTTTHFLELLQARGWLRFHRVLPRQMRRRGLIFEHWTAIVESRDDGERFAVDSWFFDHGDPAAIIPLADWQDGHDPDIRHRVAEAIQEQMERQVTQ